MTETLPISCRRHGCTLLHKVASFTRTGVESGPWERGLWDPHPLKRTVPNTGYDDPESPTGSRRIFLPPLARSRYRTERKETVRTPRRGLLQWGRLVSVGRDGNDDDVTGVLTDHRSVGVRPEDFSGRRGETEERQTLQP